MKTVTATWAKNRFGEVLADALRAPVALERHGRVVAYLVSAETYAAPEGEIPPSLTRDDEARLLDFCAALRLDPVLWRAHGSPYFMAGVATLLASLSGLPRQALLDLAERLHPGMSRPEQFSRWLERSPLHATRFAPMLRERLARAP
ncbi:MAG: type II toxin-antitoxin system Phd/YefM family antitoxin [Burkholderiales bacterium]